MTGHLPESQSLTSRRASTRLCLVSLVGWAVLVFASFTEHRGDGQYGPVLGGPGPLNIMSLPKSIKIGSAVFLDHVPTPERHRARSAQLFDWIKDGKLRVRIGGEYPLADAARAHADIESRKTSGKLLLLP
jgi:NADPH:quinone reductase-like Zn-dependent oxidoreductase